MVLLTTQSALLTLIKAIFLDRDGVLNRELGRYVTNVSEFEILPTVMEALRRAADAGYVLIIISNQGGVAKGLYTIEDVWSMHAKLQDALQSLGVSITEGYYCPHHPDHGRCLCRKPGSLMLEKAIARFGIDASKSFMIGDRDRDMVAAQGAGVVGVFMPTNADLSALLKELI
jgi:D-glycero-D-manno-heptose 1,7-bisphosphate phosphatase